MPNSLNINTLENFRCWLLATWESCSVCPVSPDYVFPPLCPGVTGSSANGIYGRTNASGLWNTKQRYWDVNDTEITVNDKFALKGEFSLLWKSVHNGKGEARKRWPLSPLRAWEDCGSGLVFQVKFRWPDVFRKGSLYKWANNRCNVPKQWRTSTFNKSGAKRHRSKTPHLAILLGNCMCEKHESRITHSCWFCTDVNLL